MTQNPMLNIIIRWPKGTMLPVMIPSKSYLSDLYKLLDHAMFPKRDIILLFNGTYLQYSDTIKSAHIKSGSQIDVVFKPPPKPSFHSSIIHPYESVKREKQRIKDLKLFHDPPPEHNKGSDLLSCPDIENTLDSGGPEIGSFIDIPENSSDSGTSEISDEISDTSTIPSFRFNPPTEQLNIPEIAHISTDPLPSGWTDVNIDATWPSFLSAADILAMTPPKIDLS